jgi:hypothetical protein
MEETGILENAALLSLVLPDFEPGLKDLIFLGNLQKIMNRVLAAERMS